MKIDWSGVVKEMRSLSPALWGRVIRHVLLLLAGAGLLKGLTADQTNALQGLIEIAVGLLLFIVSHVLSHSSDEVVKAKAKLDPLSEDDLAKLIDEAGRDVDVPPDRWGPVARTIDHGQQTTPTTPLAPPKSGGER